MCWSSSTTGENVRIRLTHITTRSSGQQARREERLELNEFRIGRGTDNTLSLQDIAVYLHHAVLRRRLDGIFAEAVDVRAMQVNGRLADVHRLEPGDVLRFGEFALRVVAPEAGEDLALEVEQVDRRGTEREELSARTRIGVRSGLFATMLISLTILGVASLLWFSLISDAGRQSRSVGTISQVHSAFATDCTKCHALPFQLARDADCASCHASTGAHVSSTIHATEFENRRCASCHMEHRGAQGLAAIEQKACAACHGGLRARGIDTKTGNASDFDRDHPQFRLSLVNEPGTGRRERVEWSSALREKSGIEFSHLRHVGQVVVGSSKNEEAARNMQCGECHELDATGKRFTPISFDKHCASCHVLSFDERFPKRQALHGDAKAMREDLRGAYAVLALSGQVQDPNAPAVIRRAAPGRELNQDERRAVLQWVEQQVQSTSDFLMTKNTDRDSRAAPASRGACAECHPVLRAAAKDGGDDVAPVELAERWLPKAEFSHRAHAPSPCKDCHAAAAVYDAGFVPDHVRPAWSMAKAGSYELALPAELLGASGRAPSKTSSDILIPEIAQCRNCHGGATAGTSRVASDCVLCHVFHRPENGPMRTETSTHAGLAIGELRARSSSLGGVQ